MGGGGSLRHANHAGRYLSGLCAAGLGLCAAGWLVLTPFAFGYRGTSHGATLTDLATGSVLAAVCLATLVAWDADWRRAMRADGVLTGPPGGRAWRWRARDGATSPVPDPDQVLTALRALLAQPAVAGGDAPAAAPAGSVIPEPRNSAGPANGVAVIESMAAGAGPLVPGCENETTAAGAAPLLPGYEDEETW